MLIHRLDNWDYRANVVKTKLTAIMMKASIGIKDRIHLSPFTSHPDTDGGSDDLL